MGKPWAASSDTQPGWSCQQLTVGTPVAPGARSLCVNCTTAGSAVIKFQDGTSLTLNFPNAGIYEFNWSVIEVVSIADSFAGQFYLVM